MSKETPIRPEFWIECQECEQESVMVEYVPGTHRLPNTKKEAWLAAAGSGWTGSQRRPVCPDCSEG